MATTTSTETSRITTRTVCWLARDLAHEVVVNSTPFGVSECPPTAQGTGRRRAESSHALDTRRCDHGHHVWRGDQETGAVRYFDAGEINIVVSHDDRSRMFDETSGLCPLSLAIGDRAERQDVDRQCRMLAAVTSYAIQLGAYPTRQTAGRRVAGLETAWRRRIAGV